MSLEVIQNQRLLGDKSTEDAIKNHDKFKVLSPNEQLEVIVSDLIENEKINYGNLEFFLKQEEINGNDYINNEYFKLIQLIRWLDEANGKDKVETIINTKMIELCLPKIITIKNKITTKNLELYAKNLNKVKGDGLDKLILLLTIFPKNPSIEIVNKLDLGENGAKYILALDIMEDFTIINDKVELKRFIYKYGLDFYDYMFKLSANYIKAYEFPEYRYLSKKYLIEDIYTNEEPIFLEDLAIDENDLVENGITDSDGAKEMLLLLIEHIHNKPFKNKRVVLLEESEKLKKSKIKRIFRKVNWIR